MKRAIFAAILLLALTASLAMAAYSNIGYIDSASGTDTISVSWTGRSAGNLSVKPASQDVVLTLVPNRNDDGSSITVKAGTTLTLDGLDIKGFDIVRASATAVEVLWW